jgi:hypothetical protein
MGAISFKKRKVGRADLELTELGLGSATLACMFGTEVTDDEARGWSARHGMRASVTITRRRVAVDTVPHAGHFSRCRRDGMGGYK